MNPRGSFAWQDFWKRNCAASCVPDDPATAEQIAAAWREWLGEIRDGSRILDIATGNGIVLAYAAAAARQRGHSVGLTGIDLAEIDPVRYMPDLDPALRAATFIGGVAAESLPFPDRSFDIVTSQFGLEYANLDAALAEAARVLVPGGFLIWLAHGETSEVVRQHRNQVLEIDYLLGPRGPVYCMSKFISRMRRRKQFEFSVDLLYRSFAEARAFADAHPPASIVREVCGEFAAIVGRGPAQDPSDLAGRLAAAEYRLLEHRARIKTMVAAVLTAERLERTRRCLSAPVWCDLSIAELAVGERQSAIGIRLFARRAKSE